jgi:hypothetical protein
MYQYPDHMKPVITTPKKLNLNRESVRSLDAAELQLAAGGMRPVTNGGCGGDTSKRIC